MRKFIEIGSINDFYERVIFGYVVYDIETKEIKYYTYFDKYDIYTPNTLHEFDPDNKDPNYYVNDHDFFGRYKREKIFPILPDELIEEVNLAMEPHLKFNKENNLPTKYLEENQKYLSMDYAMDIVDFLHRDIEDLLSAYYDSAKNSINFFATKFDYANLTDEGKDELKHACRHEVGHMKVTNNKLDEVNNKLFIQTGFNHNTRNVHPIKTDDGNVVYLLGETDPNRYYELEYALEEFANDFDCLLTFKGDYQGVYPTLGSKLNNLFKGQLLNLRYTSTVADLIAYLQEIIPSERKAFELFCTLYDSICKSTRKEAVPKALALIADYEKKLK